MKDRRSFLKALVTVPAVAAGVGVTHEPAKPVVTVSVSAWDAEVVAKWLKNGGDRQLAKAILPQLANVIARQGLS